ncbi:anti-sigma factor [Radiobacillus kanasensis]|uniref:anti-sigma factor family protein n=1 Tax=Radiobacillus kanasensis TaxID=2844358 RepID=UPI001E339FED|nr:anti-sigma factor [Radiobacillus kanasensis]UFT99546.1 anti-sigma factor [Radiobacillus kanasensis]
MECNKEAVKLMHKYLDRELSQKEEQDLRAHLQTCERCQEHFHDLKRTVTLLESTSTLQAPTHFTAKVMDSLPREKKRVSYRRWFRAHPIVTAAAIFFILMFSSAFSMWNENGQVSVSKQENLIIKDGTVIVPEGVTVEGDLVVKNGNLDIKGAVDGNVIVINGEHLMASAGQVTGEIKQVNQIFGWMWYHLKDFTESVFSFSGL